MSSHINQTTVIAGAAGFLLFPVLKWLFGIGAQTIYNRIQTEDPHRINVKNRSDLGKASRSHSKPCILVVGSANADIYIKSDEIPKAGETIDGELILIGPGGKGSNQAAACIRTLSKDKLRERGYDADVQLITVLGDDAHARMFLKAYDGLGLNTSLVLSTSNTDDDKKSSSPTGQAYILLDSHGNNSIIICPGANMMFPPMYHVFPRMFDSKGTLVRTAAQVLYEQLTESNPPSESPKSSCILEHISPSLLQSLHSIRIVLLQREIPDSVNLCIALACLHYNLYWKVDPVTQNAYCSCQRQHRESSLLLTASQHDPQLEDSTHSSGDFTEESPLPSTESAFAPHYHNYDIYTHPKKAKSPPIFIMQDVGGMASPLDLNVTKYIHLLSMNETEMGRVVTQAYTRLMDDHATPSVVGSIDSIIAPGEHADNFHLSALVNSDTGCVYLDPESAPLSHIPVLSAYHHFTPGSHTARPPVSITSLSHNDVMRGLEHVPPFDISRFIHCANVIIALCSRIPGSGAPSAPAEHSTSDDHHQDPQLPPCNPYPMLVQVTLGPHGSLLLGFNTVIGYQPAAPVEQVVDTTGCGDTFVGAFCASYVESLLSSTTDNSGRIDFQYAMKMATTAASITLSRIGTLIAIPTREEINTRLTDIAKRNAASN